MDNMKREEQEAKAATSRRTHSQEGLKNDVRESQGEGRSPSCIDDMYINCHTARIGCRWQVGGRS